MTNLVLMLLLSWSQPIFNEDHVQTTPEVTVCIHVPIEVVTSPGTACKSSDANKRNRVALNTPTDPRCVRYDKARTRAPMDPYLQAEHPSKLLIPR